MKKVALIFPYFRTRSSNEILFPPLGIVSLISQFRLLGIESRVLDCTFLDMKNLQDALIEYQPGIVGIYSMVTLRKNAFQIADLVRTFFPVSLLVAGGPMPTLYPELYNEHFDAVFRGESDLSFPFFCRDYFSADQPRDQLNTLTLREYPGLYIQSRDLNIQNPPNHYAESVLQSFPIPDRSAFNHPAYQAEWLKREGTKTTSLITSLGCPFQCDFCSKPVFGDQFRRRSMDAIFEEIRDIKKYGYDDLWIADDNFTLDPNHLIAFCNRLAGLGITWSCLSRTTGISPAVIKMMKESGCRKVYLGLETASQTTLDLMQKRVSVEENINAVHHFNDMGIDVAAFFIVGYPGETKDSIEKTFQMALDLPLKECSFNVPFPLPGSRLFDRVVELDPDLDWTMENETTFIYRSEFDADWIKLRIQQTMQRFAEKRRSVSN